jgi:hypothetical protein
VPSLETAVATARGGALGAISARTSWTKSFSVNFASIDEAKLM